MLSNHLSGFDSAQLEEAGLRAIVQPHELLAMQAALAAVRVDVGLLDYITELTGRTRAHRAIAFGASPRAAVALLAAARALAAAAGRDFVVPDDVKKLAAPVLRHRLLLQPDAELEGVSPDDCIDDILREASVPRTAAA
jgi:MoxR-like ATPase